MQFSEVCNVIKIHLPYVDFNNLVSFPEVETIDLASDTNLSHQRLRG